MNLVELVCRIIGHDLVYYKPEHRACWRCGIEQERKHIHHHDGGVVVDEYAWMNLRHSGKRRMKNSDFKNTIYVGGNAPKPSTKWFVKNEAGELIFETEAGADVALQWAIDYHGSGETAK